MIVLDTHLMIWDALAPNRLSTRAQQEIAQANQSDGMLVSTISLWEVAMLVEKGRLQIATDSHSFINLLIQAKNIRLVAISPQIAVSSVQFSAAVNKDPADRLIAATTVTENASLLTADRNLQAAHEIPTIW